MQVKQRTVTEAGTILKEKFIKNIINCFQCTTEEADKIYNMAVDHFKESDCNLEYAVAMEIARHCRGVNLMISELILKIRKEMYEYKFNLANGTVGNAIDHSYETAVKEEIISYVESSKVSAELVSNLVSREKPLDYLYNMYIKSDSANLFHEIENLFNEMRVA